MHRSCDRSVGWLSWRIDWMPNEIASIALESVIPDGRHTGKYPKKIAIPIGRETDDSTPCITV
ncbi:MAG TPA: hypothetical protein PK765_03010 [bacterium]|nr:hypothetical protein [bacterium]